MAKLNELGLTPEAVGDPIDYANLPEQMGGTYPDPPYPGSYRFKLPADLSAVWETFTANSVTTPNKTRISAVFDEAHPLTIVQSPGGKENGSPFQTKISNAERKRGRKDDASAPSVSDMDYFNTEVFGIKSKPANNPAYAAEFMKHGGEEFSADIEWNWSCNPKKDIFTEDGTGRTSEVVGTKGCGNRYYQKDIRDNGMLVLSNPEDPNSEKVYPLRITCSCGANIRAFPNLVRFRK